MVPLLWGRPIVDTVVRGCGLVPPPAFPAASHTTSDVPPPKPYQREHRSAHHHATSRLGGYLHAQGLQHHRPGHAPPWRRQTERLSRPAREEALKAGGDPWLTDWTRKVGAKSHAHLRRSVKNAWIYAEISGAPAGIETGLGVPEPTSRQRTHDHKRAQLATSRLFSRSERQLEPLSG